MKTNGIDMGSQVASVLAHAQKHAKLDSKDELTHSAQELVATSFFGAMLKQARQSPFHSDMFEGGKGGAAYQEMFDQKIAEHMARGAGSKIVRPLIHKFQAGKAYQKHKAAKGGRHAHGFGSGPLGQDSHQASSFLSKMLGA